MRGFAWVLAVTVVLGAAVYLLVARAGRDDQQRMRADLTQALERATLADLGRAQALGRRLVVASRRDRDAAAALAFTDALLAVDYGAPMAEEADRALAAAGGPDGDSGDDPAGALAAAARSLVHLQRGDAPGAAGLAAVAAAGAPELPYPLYALARARARAGDLGGAGRALDAAIVAAPGFTPARVSWAQARLDAGDAGGAEGALSAVLAHAPGDPRAVLLLDQVAACLGRPAPAALEAVCRRDARELPFVAAGCALSQAARARRAGDRATSRRLAEAARRLAPDEPRLLGNVALLLAQLGAVDMASALVTRARRLAAPEMPAVAWATAAVALGRGHAPLARDEARPCDPEARLLVARLALAGGGVAALERALASLGQAAVAQDADLRTLAALVGPARVAPDAADAPPANPLRAYVSGLRANLAGDSRQAADWLGQALDGHGDACRAAGEYVGALRSLKTKARGEAFGPLRRENAACVNLPGRRGDVSGSLQ